MGSGIINSVSQIGGLLDWLKRPFQAVIDFFANLVDIVTNLPNIIITGLQYLFAAFLYIIQVGLFYIIDMVQTVFRRIAGLDVYWYKSGNSIDEHTGDIVESMLISDTVWTVFVSVLIAAIVLLFVFTIIAILKTELNEKDNAKGPVIKQALKAIAYFVIVPVVCIFGVTLANIFLRTFDAATQTNGAVSISGQVFSAASYNANRVRNGHKLIGDYTDDEGGWGRWALTKQRLSYITYTERELIYDPVYETDEEGNIVYQDGTPVQKKDKNGNPVYEVRKNEEGKPVYKETTKSSIGKDSSQAEIADFIDNCFVHKLEFGGTSGAGASIDPSLYKYDRSGYMAGYAMFVADSMEENFSTFDKTNTGLVYYYYDLLSYNWLIGYLASWTIIMLLLNLMIGVIQRIFDLTILFIVSPAFIATMPIDNGSRYGKWRDEFVKRVLGCYGPIIGINLAFTILTLVQRIYIFGPSEPMSGLFNSLMQCVFVIVAILCVKDFGKLLNGLIGGQDISDNKAGQARDLMLRGAAAGATGLAMGAKFAADSRKLGEKKKALAGKEAAEATAKTNLDNFDSTAQIASRRDDFFQNYGEQKAKEEWMAQREKDRLEDTYGRNTGMSAAKWARMSEAGKRKMLEEEYQKHISTAAGRASIAADATRHKMAYSLSSEGNAAFAAADAKDERRIALQNAYASAQDATDAAKIDVTYQDAKRWNKLNDLAQNLKKAGNRDAYIGAWDKAGGDKAMETVRDAWGDPVYKKFDDAKRDKGKADNERDRSTTAVNDRKVAIEGSKEFRVKRR